MLTVGNKFDVTAIECDDDCNLRYASGGILSNCIPTAQYKTALLDTLTGENVCVKVRLDFKRMYNEEEKHIKYDVDIKKLDKLKLSEIHPDLYTSSDSHMIKYIRWLTADAPTIKKYYIDILGWVCIKGCHLFNCGVSLIGNTEGIEYEIDSKLSHISVNANPDLNSKDASKAVWDIFRECDRKTRLIILYIFGALLRQMFKDAGYVPKTVIYIEAGTQSGKTTLSQSFGCPFISKDGSIPNYTRVSSTQAFVEDAVSYFKDMLYIYDDVYCDNDKRIRRCIEERVKAILRNYADNAPRNKKGASNKINAQVLLIGEELIQSVSNVGRLLVIRLDNKFSTGLLKSIRKHKQYINTFYLYFIEWLSKNYDEIVEDIAKEFEAFVEIQRSEVSRDFDNRFFMSCIAKIFCQYMYDNDFISEELTRTTICEIRRDLEVVFGENKKIFASAARKENAHKDINYSKVLCDLIERGDTYPKSKGSDFFEKQCNGEKCYYIRCEYFQNLLLKYYGKQDSAKKITDYFRIRMIGVFGNDGKVKQYKNGKRYLVLKRDELYKDANGAFDFINSIL